MDIRKHKRPKKPPFPAMSAHFAYTLDDMAEQYIQAQYIELGASTGILEPEDLKKLVESRSNLVVYQDRVFRFSRKEGQFIKYISLYVDGLETDFHGQQALIQEESGKWVITDLVSEDKEEIDNLKEEVKDMKVEFKEDIDETREELVVGINDLQDQIDSLKMDGGEIE